MTRMLTLVLLLASTLAAQEPAGEPSLIRWTATDAAGRTITVPDAQKPTVILFVMANQRMSAEAMTQLLTALGDDADRTQVIAVASGRDAEAHVDAVRRAGRWTAPIVVDPSYAACELMGVRAWPTTVIVDQTGRELGHIGGLPRAYQKDLEAYLAFAHGRIDADALREKLDTHHLVISTTSQAIVGHLQAARRLLERGDAQAAREQLDAALALEPNDPSLLLTLARTHVLLGRPAEALAALDRIEPGSLAPFQINVVRARALLLQDKWDEARDLLAGSLKLNPDPAETHYLLGRIEQHHENWPAAAEHYRAAFEATHDARVLGVSADQP